MALPINTTAFGDSCNPCAERGRCLSTGYPKDVQPGGLAVDSLRSNDRKVPNPEVLSAWQPAAMRVWLMLRAWALALSKMWRAMKQVAVF